MADTKRLEEAGILELIAQYNLLVPEKKQITQWKSSRRRLVMRIEALQAKQSKPGPAKQADWPYRLFTKAEYDAAILRAGVEPRDIARIACEKLLAVVVGTREIDIEVRGENRKYLRTDTVDCAYGIPYELILDYLKQTFPDKATSYHCLRWYMVRMRENSGQHTSQKKMDPKKLQALKLNGADVIPDRRERLMRAFQKGAKS